MSRPDETTWEAGWSDHELRQLRRLAELTLVEKLEWLEQAQSVVQHLADSRRAHGAGTADHQPAVGTQPRSSR